MRVKVPGHGDVALGMGQAEIYDGDMVFRDVVDCWEWRKGIAVYTKYRFVYRKDVDVLMRRAEHSQRMCRGELSIYLHGEGGWQVARR